MADAVRWLNMKVVSTRESASERRKSSFTEKGGQATLIIHDV